MVRFGSKSQAQRRLWMRLEYEPGHEIVMGALVMTGCQMTESMTKEAKMEKRRKRGANLSCCPVDSNNKEESMGYGPCPPCSLSSLLPK